MELVTFHFDQVNVYSVCKQNNRPSGISHLAILLVGLNAGTHRIYEYRKLSVFSLLVLYAALLPDLFFQSKSCVLYSNFYGISALSFVFYTICCAVEIFLVRLLY